VKERTRGTGVPGGNPNVSSSQFDNSPVIDTLRKAADKHAITQHFRQNGFGDAIRYTLGLRQIPSHMTDFINAQTRVNTRTGIQPGPKYQRYHPEDLA
jgi:hypothetical protein